MFATGTWFSVRADAAPPALAAVVGVRSHAATTVSRATIGRKSRRFILAPCGGERVPWPILGLYRMISIPARPRNDCSVESECIPPRDAGHALNPVRTPADAAIPAALFLPFRVLQRLAHEAERAVR